MIGISFFRILRNALLNVRRNIWLSIATTLIMTLTLLMMSFLYFVNVIGDQELRTIEQKVDLSAVFKDGTTDNQIQTLAQDMQARSDVAEVRVVSSEEALEQFKQRHANTPFIEESLKELNDNPLPSSMYIIATEPRFYENIATQLQSETYVPYVEKVNYEDTRMHIEKLITLMSAVRNFGFAVTFIFASLVILIMFNTIRLAIYSFREEIDIMRLVGASNWYIRGPFIFEAVIVAMVSVAISTLITYPSLSALAPSIGNIFTPDRDGNTINIYEHAIENWPTIIGLQAGLAIALAVVSSVIAVRRYLRS